MVALATVEAAMLRRDAFWEYIGGSMWFLPVLSAAAALALGASLSVVDVSVDSPLAFQGTADDARNLLIGVTATMVTVIALLLGLAVVALQLSSTQFSPRLLRNFLRDRPNQVVLSTFVATFTYSAAGLYTVGVSGGNRTAEFPRLAVTGSLVLLFASLVLLVYFAHHLAHSIQIDAIMRVVEHNTLAVIGDDFSTGDGKAPAAPQWAVPVAARASGYLQAVRLDELLARAERHAVSIRLQPRVGEHVVAGGTLAWVWRPTPDDPGPAPTLFGSIVNQAVRIGFERTFQQDVAFGIRQLVDIASKALSPAVNDPYSAVQAVDHLSVIFSVLAARPAGDHVARRSDDVMVIVPGWRFSQYLAIACGLIRRYGAGEPTVAHALLRLLGTCTANARDDPERWAAIEEQARLVVEASQARVAQPEDLVVVRVAADSLRQALAARRADATTGDATHSGSPATITSA
jgi:uncharacterized membrane protein